MLKYMMLTTALILGANSAMAQADPYAWVSGAWSMPTKEPNFAYNLETAGKNVRVYEWHLASDPDRVCIAMFGSGGTPGVQCFKDPK